jgi:hypothetical protein
MQAELILVALVTALAGSLRAEVPQLCASSSLAGRVGIPLGAPPMVLSPSFGGANGRQARDAGVVVPRACALDLRS